MTIQLKGSNGTNAVGTSTAAGVNNGYVLTAGRLAIVTGGVWHSGAIPTSLVLTDTRGNSIPSPTTNLGLNVSRACVWIIPVTAGGAGNFNLTVSNAGFTFSAALDVYDYSGCDSGGALDGTPATNTGTGASIASGNLVTASPGSLVLSSYFDQSNRHTCTHSLGGTQEINNQVADGETLDEMDLITTMPGTWSDTVSGFPGSNAVFIALIGVKALASASALHLHSDNYF